MGRLVRGVEDGDSYTYCKSNCNGTALIMTSDDKFMDLYMKGEVCSGDIDHFIEKWHALLKCNEHPPLHEYLGMTWNEYAAWLKNPDVLPELADRRDLQLFEELYAAQKQ